MMTDPMTLAFAMELNAAAGGMDVLGMVLTALSVVFLVVLLVADQLSQWDADTTVEPVLDTEQADTDFSQAA